jgi:hypothetical protein
MITDIDARREGSLTSPLDYQSINCRVLRAGGERHAEFPQHGDIQNIQRRAVHRDSNQPFLLFDLYAHCSLLFFSD